MPTCHMLILPVLFLVFADHCLARGFQLKGGYPFNLKTVVIASDSVLSRGSRSDAQLATDLAALEAHSVRHMEAEPAQELSRSEESARGKRMAADRDQEYFADRNRRGARSRRIDSSADAVGMLPLLVFFLQLGVSTTLVTMWHRQAVADGKTMAWGVNSVLCCLCCQGWAVICCPIDEVDPPVDGPGPAEESGEPEPPPPPRLLREEEKALAGESGGPGGTSPPRLAQRDSSVAEDVGTTPSAPPPGSVPQEAPSMEGGGPGSAPLPGPASEDGSPAGMVKEPGQTPGSAAGTEETLVEVTSPRSVLQSSSAAMAPQYYHMAGESPEGSSRSASPGEREDHDGTEYYDLANATTPRVPGPEARRNLVRMESATDLKRRADAEAARLMDAIASAMADRALEALRTALQAAGGRPGVSKRVMEEGYSLLAELAREARQEAALAALRAAVARRSIVALRSALGQARRAPLAGAETREALETLRALEEAPEMREAREHLPLVHTAMRQKDPELLGQAVQIAGAALPRDEVMIVREHIEQLKADKVLRFKVRGKLKRQMAAFKTDEAVTATEIAAAIDEAREAGIPRDDLERLLREWDPRGEFHEVATVEEETTMLRIKIKRSAREMAALRSGGHPDQKAFVRALMPAHQDQERKVLYDEDFGKYMAQLPVGGAPAYGPERLDRAVAEADLAALCGAVDQADDEGQAQALRAVQLELHRPVFVSAIIRRASLMGGALASPRRRRESTPPRVSPNATIEEVD